MAARVKKLPDEEDQNTPVNTGEGEKEETKVNKSSPQYTRGLKKIASYSGVLRIMKCTNKCGKFDDIANIYVFPTGAEVSAYNVAENKVVDELIGQNSISKSAVRKHGYKNLARWGSHDTLEDRRKKLSNPVKRITSKKKKNGKKKK